jgi:hypothetical protein
MFRQYALQKEFVPLYCTHINYQNYVWNQFEWTNSVTFGSKRRE